jgi:hypothetical protein
LLGPTGIRLEQGIRLRRFGDDRFLFDGPDDTFGAGGSDVDANNNVGIDLHGNLSFLVTVVGISICQAGVVGRDQA